MSAAIFISAASVRDWPLTLDKTVDISVFILVKAGEGVTLRYRNLDSAITLVSVVNSRPSINYFLYFGVPIPVLDVLTVPPASNSSLLLRLLGVPPM